MNCSAFMVEPGRATRYCALPEHHDGDEHSDLDVVWSTRPRPRGLPGTRPAAQPDPTPNDARPVWEVVIEDMQKRDHVGRARYGTPLQPNNGRDALRDAYEEALDLAVYLRQAIIERDVRRAAWPIPIRVNSDEFIHAGTESFRIACGILFTSAGGLLNASVTCPRCIKEISP